MLYLSLGFRLLLILAAGVGLYRYWTRRLGGATVDWLMLPAALVAEAAYSAGRLMTGRPAYGGLLSPQDASADACRFAISGKNGFFVSMLSSFLTMALCGLVLAAATKWIGRDVVRALTMSHLAEGASSLPTMPWGWKAFWEFLSAQVNLLRRFLEMLAERNWLDWRVGLYVYLSAIFSVRMGAVRHDWRATFASAMLLAALTAVAGTIFPPVHSFAEGELQYLLTYIWATLLGLLAATLVLTGLAVLVQPFLPARWRTK